MDTGKRGQDLEAEIADVAAGLERQDVQRPGVPAAAARPNPRALITAAAALLVVVLAAMTLGNLLGHGPLWTRGWSSARDAEQVRLEDMRDAVEEIEAFRIENGRLPTSLAEAEVSESSGLWYSVLDGDRYVLRVGSGGSLLEYRSDTDAEAFFSARLRTP